MSRPPWSTGTTGEPTKRRIKPHFWQIFSGDVETPNSATVILWSQIPEEGIWDRAQDLAERNDHKVKVYAVYKNPPNEKGLDRYELIDSIYPPTRKPNPKAGQSQDRKDMKLGRALMGGESLIDAATLGRIFREKGAELAERAVWAAYQDDIVDLAMVDDLEAHVRRAVTIAFETKDNEEAIDEAQTDRR